MKHKSSDTEPDWETPVTVSLSPASIIYSVFATAEAVHTAWESCVDPALMVAELTASDDLSDNYCRLVEQEYLDEERGDVTWHDWSVELKLGATIISAHWRAQVGVAPFEWDWAGKQAEKAFAKASLLVGKPVRRAIAVEQAMVPGTPDGTRH